MSYKIEPIPLAHNNIGKAPFWNPKTQSLYYVDLYWPAILRYDFTKKTTYKAQILKETMASFVIPIQHIKRFFLVGLNRKVGVVEWDGISEFCEVVKIVFEVESDEIYSDNRFNIGKIDPEGCFFGSTMCGELGNKKNLGKLYRYQGGQKQPPIILLDNISIASGFAWYPTTNKFYFIDSVHCEIEEYDYDRKTGNINNPKHVTNFREKNFPRISIPKKSTAKYIPNDVTVDLYGYLYVCGLGSPIIYKIDPSTGVIESEIVMPTKTITAITFGGPNMNILYATTAGMKYMNIEPDKVDNGEVYQITNLSTGIEMQNMKLKLCLCPLNTNK